MCGKIFNASALNRALLNVSMKGDIEKIKEIIRLGAEINAIDPEDRSTALSQAARHNHKAAVEFLISKGANAYSKDLALIFASQQGNAEMIKILVSAGANGRRTSFDEQQSASQ